MFFQHGHWPNIASSVTYWSKQSQSLPTPQTLPLDGKEVKKPVPMFSSSQLFCEVTRSPKLEQQRM